MFWYKANNANIFKSEVFSSHKVWAESIVGPRIFRCTFWHKWGLRQDRSGTRHMQPGHCCCCCRHGDTRSNDPISSILTCLGRCHMICTTNCGGSKYTPEYFWRYIIYSDSPCKLWMSDLFILITHLESWPTMGIGSFWNWIKMALFGLKNLF